MRRCPRLRQHGTAALGVSRSHCSCPTSAHRLRKRRTRSNNVGMLTLFYAAEATIKKAAAHGIALVSVNDAWMSGRSA
jgi:hypothetical protein